MEATERLRNLYKLSNIRIDEDDDIVKLTENEINEFFNQKIWQQIEILLVGRRSSFYQTLMDIDTPPEADMFLKGAIRENAFILSMKLILLGNPEEDIDLGGVIE